MTLAGQVWQIKWVCESLTLTYNNFDVKRADGYWHTEKITLCWVSSALWFLFQRSKILALTLSESPNFHPTSDKGILHKSVVFEGDVHIVEEIQLLKNSEPIKNLLLSSQVIIVFFVQHLLYHFCGVWHLQNDCTDSSGWTCLSSVVWRMG